MRWPSMLWLVVMLCLLGWGLLWWFVLGAGRAARGRALQARIRLWERTHPPPSAATLRALHRVAQDARRAMRATGGRQGLHRQPWVLVVGDPAADLLSLLAAAHPAGPIASAAADDGDLFWRWWLTGRLAAIEVCPPPLAPALPQDSLWLRAVRELVRLRPRLPLDGIALCVSTATLQADASVAQPVLDLLCRRVQDALHSLRIHAPVYVIVTGLQRLPGYATLRAALPAEALARAWGSAAGQAAEPMARPALDPLFGPLMLRLHALRLGLQPTLGSASQRADVHAFVEAMQALKPGLDLLVEQMARCGGPRGALPWRGLYFTASGPDCAFVDGLFGGVIPDDRGLAQPEP